MASSDILSQTLSAITAIKLEELTSQRALFEEGKKDLLNSIDAETSQTKRIHIFLDRFQQLHSTSEISPSRSNIGKFLEQSTRDPSVSENLQKEWENQLRRELEIQSAKYDYASLYGELVKEWLSTSSESFSSSGFEKVGRKEMHAQRKTWEAYVFKAKQTDTVAITSYLENLFGSSKHAKDTHKELCSETSKFEDGFTRETHFNQLTLQWVIKGLLRSDLVTDEKRKVLKDFLNNTIVLDEVADVLNMRMSSLDKWKWDPQGTLVEQRRQLNGRYRFYHDEDLLQAIMLRYIGVRWSVFFKEKLTAFLSPFSGWKKSTAAISPKDMIRRDHFIGPGSVPDGLERAREEHFRKDIFLSQLQGENDEIRAGYEDDLHNSKADTRESPQRITQRLLRVLATETLLKTRFGQDICVVRSDFKWFGPSLPHSTMLAVLKFFNVSDDWIDFFRRVLEAPMKFADGPIQVRRRGTPISGPLSVMLGETTLFILDFAFNQLTDGAHLYRLHDDIWFWGQEETCIKGWEAMTEFTNLMGLEVNRDKTGSALIPGKKDGKVMPVSYKLPRGEVHWGFLKLDCATGRFLIDQESLDKHIEELRCQLASCKSVFDWIHAWNIYGTHFFTNHFGWPGNCYGIAHVDMLLDTFSQIQKKLFASTGGSVTSTVKQMLTERFGVKNIPEGYLYFPMSRGGLDLKSPFINLYLMRDQLFEPDGYIEKFLKSEEEEYDAAKQKYENGGKVSRDRYMVHLDQKLMGAEFMSLAEFSRYRESLSSKFQATYLNLIKEPDKEDLEPSHPSLELSSDVLPYDNWVIQLYGQDIISRFGSLNIVDKGLIPTGVVTMFRESRFKWDE